MKPPVPQPAPDKREAVIRILDAFRAQRVTGQVVVDVKDGAVMGGKQVLAW